MTWISTATYSARIGGVIYRNVRCPISINGACAIRLTRHSKVGNLAVSFDLRRADGTDIALVKNSIIGAFDAALYQLFQADNRSALIEARTGRVWCEIITPQAKKDYEIDISCILFAGPAYPIFLHPDRTKFAMSNDRKSPTMSDLTLTTDLGNKATAIGTERPIYLLAVMIENFDVGIEVKPKTKSGSD